MIPQNDYFVLHPAGSGIEAEASKAAMIAYAEVLQKWDPDRAKTILHRVATGEQDEVQKIALLEEIARITESIRNQDNRCTKYPLYLVQEKRREVGFDANYADGKTVFLDMDSDEPEECDPDTPGAEEFGYKDVYETIMTCFTEHGAQAYLDRVKHRYKGDLSIYVDSAIFCEEMIVLQKWLSSDEFGATCAKLLRVIKQLENAKETIEKLREELAQKNLQPGG